MHFTIIPDSSGGLLLIAGGIALVLLVALLGTRVRQSAAWVAWVAGALALTAVFAVRTTTMMREVIAESRRGLPADAAPLDPDPTSGAVRMAVMIFLVLAVVPSIPGAWVALRGANRAAGKRALVGIGAYLLTLALIVGVALAFLAANPMV